MSRYILTLLLFSLLVVFACTDKPRKSLDTLLSEWNFHVQSGKLEEAEKISLQMLETADELKGKESREYASALSKMALAKQLQGSYSEAIDWFNRELALNRKLFGSNNPDVALSLSNIGSCLKASDHYEAAIDTLKESLEVFAQSKSLLEDESGYIHTYHLLATTYLEMKRYNEAAIVLQNALDTPYIQNVKDTAQVITILSSTALLALEQKDFPLAETLSRRAFALTREAFGSWSVYMADVLNIMGGLGKELKEYPASEEAFLMSLRIRDSLRQQDDYYVLTLNNLATLYMKMEKYSQADSLLDRAAELCGEFGGANSLVMATVLGNQASLAVSLGRPELAEQYLLQSLGIYEKRIGSNSILVVGVLESLLNIYNKTGQNEKVPAVEARIRQIKEANLAT